MRIIISPAKKMNIDNDSLVPKSLPVFSEDEYDYVQTNQICFSTLKVKSLLYMGNFLCYNDLVRSQNREI